MTTHIMLDLGTWGTRPGCDIRSIGACVFAPEARHGGWLVHDGTLGTIRPFYIACDNPGIPDGTETTFIPGHGMCQNAEYPHADMTSDTWRKYPLHRDPENVQWWSEQSDEARAAFADPVDLKQALYQFSDWLACVDMGVSLGANMVIPKDGLRNVSLWSHGPHFDISILGAAYEAVGLPIPWHYRAPRDTRTCFDMAGITDHGAWLTQHATGAEVAHHALHDAIVQARAVCAAIERSKHPQWTKVTQEAPPMHTSVLVRSWGVGPTYDVAVWTGERFIFADVSLDPKQVTHWAPIRDLVTPC